MIMSSQQHLMELISEGIIKMYKKIDNYRETPFSDEVRHGDFYIYGDVKDLPEKCEKNRNSITKCRTIGILQSQYGSYYLYDLDATGIQTQHNIKVSTVYMKKPVQSTVPPYPAQVFGTLQYSDNRPVLFINFLQVLTVPTAIRYKDIMSKISKHHLSDIKVDFDPINQEEEIN